MAVGDVGGDGGVRVGSTSSWVERCPGWVGRDMIQGVIGGVAWVA